MSYFVVDCPECHHRFNVEHEASISGGSVAGSAALELLIECKPHVNHVQGLEQRINRLLDIAFPVGANNRPHV